MDDLARFLQAVGYHAVQIQPMVPTFLHLILSAIFPIYAGAHASLSRPSSAAKPAKRMKEYDEDDEPDEHNRKMEGMSPSDAIILPLFAGLTLAGLYVLIKWLEDPVILNKILNWYYSFFGILALTRLITDTMKTLTSFIFPEMYTLGGQTWTIHAKQRMAISNSSPPGMRDSPLPSFLSNLPLPKAIKHLLWRIRGLESQKLQFRIFIRGFISTNTKFVPQLCISFLVAFAAQLYFNLISKPWWLTNALGFGFAYSILQLLSPTESLTGTLVLCALFVYDIYFVFFTPLMVTVATKLDIPAKLLFPRPSGPYDDPTKKHLSMLGLGDVILPGMMIGFALRFDLYLYYLRKQIRKETQEDNTREKSPPNDKKLPNSETPGYVMEKDTYYPAVSGWGEKFWSTRGAIITSSKYHGTIFPKPYFHATLVGYVLGMLLTLGIMQIYGHAQPALLYLVPGVLGALWGTALVRGEARILWRYSEDNSEEEAKDKKEKGDEVKKNEESNNHNNNGWTWKNWHRIFSPSSYQSATNPTAPDSKNKKNKKKTIAGDDEQESSLTTDPKKKPAAAVAAKETKATADGKFNPETQQKKKKEDHKSTQTSSSSCSDTDSEDGKDHRERGTELFYFSVRVPSQGGT